MIDEVKIESNLVRFKELIAKDNRSEQLLDMYERRWSEQLLIAPASGRKHYHNCFPGGYLDHILRVYDLSVQMTKTFMENNGQIDFTPEEMRFAALHHDLGKLGDNDSAPYYIEETSDWHRKNQNKYYKINDQLQVMEPTHRGLAILSEEGIRLTQTEWLSILLADGLYQEGNSYYLMNNSYPYPMKTQLPNIIHAADKMASDIERGNSRF
ncbi:MAG: hypothetical protein VW683_00275 [Betaproteobacteria bacterium]|jgi:hypothetical protein